MTCLSIKTSLGSFWKNLQMLYSSCRVVDVDQLLAIERLLQIQANATTLSLYTLLLFRV